MAVEITPSQKQTLDSLCDKTPADAKFLWTLLEYAMLSYNGILQVITNTTPATPPAPVALVRTISTETGSTNSPIPAGAQSIGLIFSTDFAGTVGGAAINPAACPSYSESAGENQTLPALAYTITAGSMVRSVLTLP